jgi:hypothetical protein
MEEKKMEEIKEKEESCREAASRSEWLKTWETIGVRILKLPEWMQNIVLEDIKTAVRNRVATMEMVENAHRKNRD